MEAISYFCGRLLVVVVVVVKQAWQAEVLTPILQAVISKSIHSPIRTVPLSLSHTPMMPTKLIYNNLLKGFIKCSLHFAQRESHAAVGGWILNDVVLRLLWCKNNEQLFVYKLLLL